MKLESVEIENYRAIKKLRLPLDPSLTVLHGDNTCGKTSVLSAIAVGLGAIPDVLPGVSGIDYLETDLRVGESFVQIDLTVADGLSWKRERFLDENLEVSETQAHGLDVLKDRLAGIVRADREANPPVELPIVAFYDTDRAVLDIPEGWRSSGGDIPPYAVRMARGHESVIVERRRPPRYAALEGSLSARAKYGQLLQWFRAKEDEELREQRKRRGFDYHDKALSAVRSAITSMLDGVSDPHIEVRPFRFLVSAKQEGGSVTPQRESVRPEDERDLTLEINQLSDGQRAVLALAADLARRMAQGNPHLDDPLASEAIVLIDEVELHLHPSWQQRILDDLRRTFRKTQFIVSTHSPQVLTTVKPEHIVELAREDGRIVAGSAAGWTYGAESGDVLSAVMRVNERPVNEFSDALTNYRRLVSEGLGESDEAVALRATLERLSPEDPALASADLEINQRRLFEEMAKSR